MKCLQELPCSKFSINRIHSFYLKEHGVGRRPYGLDKGISPAWDFEFTAHKLSVRGQKITTAVYEACTMHQILLYKTNRYIKVCWKLILNLRYIH